MRAFTRDVGPDRPPSATALPTIPRLRRFRYGVQVNSLGLTEAQPENNVARIVLEALAVILSKGSAHTLAPASRLERGARPAAPWDQQLSLRIQQILAYETDLLEYDDLFDGSPVIEAKVREIEEQALQEIERVQEIGGAVAAVESGYMKRALVESNAARVRAIEAGERAVIGVNRYEETEDSPLVQNLASSILSVEESRGSGSSGSRPTARDATRRKSRRPSPSCARS